MSNEIPKEVREDFRNHLYYCFKYILRTEPTPVQYEMAERLQRADEDFQLQAGRGFGKSTVTAFFVSWLLALNPDCTVMILSASSPKAISFISQVRKVFSLVPYMKHMEPDKDVTDNAYGFNVKTRQVYNQDLSVFARGINSSNTGSHADWVICDDIEVEKNSDTASAREKLFSRAAEIEQIRNPGMGGVRILGTPQTIESVYLKLKEAGYDVIKFPSIMPDLGNAFACMDVDPYILGLELDPGMPTQPERFSLELLMKRKAKIGPTKFALHYELDTTGADQAKFPLRLEDLIVMDVDPELFPEKVIWHRGEPIKDIGCYGLNNDLIYQPIIPGDKYVKYVSTVLYIDPSGRGADETTICVVSFVSGYCVVHELLGYDGGYDHETLVKIAKVAHDYQVDAVYYESNYGDGMFGQIFVPVLKSIYPNCGLEEFKVKGNKENRICDTLEPVMSQHRLVMNRRAIKDAETQKQITRMARKRGSVLHDDRVDVLSMGVRHFTEYMDLTVDEFISKSRKAEEEAQIQDWLNDERRAGSILGGRMSGGTRVTNHDKKQNQGNSFGSRRTWR
jgi:hypothetical protein